MFVVAVVVNRRHRGKAICVRLRLCAEILTIRIAPVVVSTKRHAEHIKHPFAIIGFDGFDRAKNYRLCVFAVIVRTFYTDFDFHLAVIFAIVFGFHTS